MNLKISTLRHIVLKMVKVNTEIIKSSKGLLKQKHKSNPTQFIYKGTVLDCQQVFQQKLCRPESDGFKVLKGNKQTNRKLLTKNTY